MTQISDAPTATEVSGPSAFTAAAAAALEGALRAVAASGGAEWTAADGWSQTKTAAAAIRRGSVFSIPAYSKMNLLLGDSQFVLKIRTPSFILSCVKF